MIISIITIKYQFKSLKIDTLHYISSLSLLSSLSFFFFLFEISVVSGGSDYYE